MQFSVVYGLCVVVAVLTAVGVTAVAEPAPAREKTEAQQEAQVKWLADALASEPTVKSGLFRVERTDLIQSDGYDVGQATVKFAYLDIDGTPKEGLACLFVRRDMLEAGQKIPLVFSAHYEFQPQDAARRCKRDWAALTPHLNAELVLGNSFNLDLALLEWARRLPFVDRTHLLIEGGSAGGYMALAMAAELLPVVATIADAPVLNWSYNLAFFDKNLPLARGNVQPGADPLSMLKAPVPFLAAVAQLSAPIEELFGKELSSTAYRDLSPIYYYERTTCPVSVALSTADVLVPMPQLSTAHFTAPDPNVFPEGFEMRLEVLASAPGTKTPFLEILPKEVQAVYVQKAPEDAPEIDPMAVLSGKQKKSKAPAIDRPFDTTKQWSIMIFDEGKPTPQSSHLKYQFDQNPNAFRAHYQKAAISLDQLNLPKLQRLMERFNGKLSDAPPLRPESASPKPVHRLSFTVLEQLDVVTGFLDYADLGPQFGKRLQDMYAQLPEGMKPWGPTMDVSQLRSLRDKLHAAAARVTVGGRQ